MTNINLDFAIHSGSTIGSIITRSHLKNSALRNGGSAYTSKSGNIIAYKELIEKNNPNHYIISTYKNSKLFHRMKVAIVKDETSNILLRTTKNSNFETSSTVRHSSISTFDKNNKKNGQRVGSQTFNSLDNRIGQKLAISENSKSIYQDKASANLMDKETFKYYKNFNMTFIDIIESLASKLLGKAKNDAGNVLYNRYF